MAGLGNLSIFAKTEALDRRRLYHLGESYGIPKILRWKPKKVCDRASAVNHLLIAHLDRPTIFSAQVSKMVVAQTIYAIVGATALEKGGDVANGIVKEKILIPLGLSS